MLAALPAEAAVRAVVDEARGAAEPVATARIAMPRREIAINGVSLEYEDGTSR